MGNRQAHGLAIIEFERITDVKLFFRVAVQGAGRENVLMKERLEINGLGRAIRFG